LTQPAELLRRANRVRFRHPWTPGQRGDHRAPAHGGGTRQCAPWRGDGCAGVSRSAAGYAGWRNASSFRGLPPYPAIRLSLPAHRRVSRYLDDFRPDIVHVATTGPLGVVGRRYALRHGVPLATSYHTQLPSLTNQ